MRTVHELCSISSYVDVVLGTRRRAIAAVSSSGRGPTMRMPTRNRLGLRTQVEEREEAMDTVSFSLVRKRGRTEHG